MSVVVLVLLVASIAAGVGLQVVMFVRNHPFYGMVGIGVLLGPSTILAFTHIAIA
jgi:hypothetical protein